MQFESWLQIALVCLLGAMSPGPSLALILSISINRGRIHGVTSSFSHGLGIALWAFLTAVGLSAIVIENSIIATILQCLGALLIIYVGINMLKTRPWKLGQSDALVNKSTEKLIKGISEGFLISLLNPKIALFFLAIFSHFISNNSNLTEIIILTITASVIDAIWYTFMSLMITVSKINVFIEKRGRFISVISGAILILIASFLIFQLTTNYFLNF